MTPSDRRIHLSGDGLSLPPADWADRLAALTRERPVEVDTYLLGGEVAAFESRCAALLRKERALFMPSGTLVNQLALRALAGERRRVIVQDASHIYNDTGDASQTLSGLTLVPVAQGRATVTRDDVAAVLKRTAGGRVPAPVGVLSIESPVRRLLGQVVRRDETLEACAFAREHGIGLHLDGARLFVAAAYAGLTPAELAAPFDTVYVSLWKCFNTGSGAILAGSRALLDPLVPLRRMFGGALATAWAEALVGGSFLDGYVDRLRAAVAVSEDVFAGLAENPVLRVERIPEGTNVATLHLLSGDPARFRARLVEAGIVAPAPNSATFTIAVNETWTRLSAEDLCRALLDAARRAA